MDRVSTIEEFRKYFKDKSLFYDLDKYLDCKEEYLKTPDDMPKEIDMTLAYEYVHSDMKYWLSCGQISMSTFNHLIDVLQEGL